MLIRSALDLQSSSGDQWSSSTQEGTDLLSVEPGARKG